MFCYINRKQRFMEEILAEMERKRAENPADGNEEGERRTTEIIPQTDKTPKQETPKIPPKPVMSAEAAAYSKLLKFYKELNCQNGIIFDAESERNELKLERDSLKGFAKLTKTGKLQSRIDRKDEKTDYLKVSLSGIVKRYGFQMVQAFCKAFDAAKNSLCQLPG